VCCGTQVGEPVPGEETLDGHNQMVTIGGDGLEKWCRGRWHIAVQQDFPLVAQDADVHGASMQVNATGKWVLCRVEAPEVSSSFARDFSYSQHTTGVC